MILSLFFSHQVWFCKSKVNWKADEFLLLLADDRTSRFPRRIDSKCRTIGRKRREILHSLREDNFISNRSGSTPSDSYLWFSRAHTTLAVFQRKKNLTITKCGTPSEAKRNDGLATSLSFLDDRYTREKKYLAGVRTASWESTYFESIAWYFSVNQVRSVRLSVNRTLADAQVQHNHKLS